MLAAALGASALFPVLFPNGGRNRGLSAGEERAPAGEDEDVRTVVATLLRIQGRVAADPGAGHGGTRTPRHTAARGPASR